MEIETIDLNDLQIGCLETAPGFSWVFFCSDIAWCCTVASKSSWILKLLLNMYAIALDIKCQTKFIYVNDV